MFLFERLFGIFTFSIILFVVVNLISKCENIKATKKILFVYLICLFFMGYFYYPYKTADLYYTNSLINNSLIYKSFSDIIVKFQNSRYAIYYIYYWFFGIIGNIKLLPAVTALFFYSNVFYILYKSCLRFKLSTKTMAKTIMFFMAGGQFLEVISGIKSMFALSIVALCCYKELIENKSFLKNIPLYIFAALMHDTALIAICIRLIYMLFQKENRLIIKVSNYIIVILFLLFAVKYGGQSIMGATNKGQSYISGNVYSNIWEYFIASFCDIFMIYSVFLMKKIMKVNNEIKKILSKYLKFIIIFLIIDVVFMFEYSIFHRYRTFIMIIIIPIVAILFEKNKNNEYAFLKNYDYRFRLYFYVTMGLSLARGNLSSLKFFDLNNW